MIWLRACSRYLSFSSSLLLFLDVQTFLVLGNKLERRRISITRLSKLSLEPKIIYMYVILVEKWSLLTQRIKNIGPDDLVENTFSVPLLL
nr:hypothetical protein Cbor_290 [Cedratvirus borely]